MNASDQNQVKAKRQTAKEARRRELADLKVVLSTPFGRRVFWRILRWLKRDGSNIFDAGELLPYRAGFYDASVWLEAEILTADPEAVLRMHTEARAEARMQEQQEPQEKSDEGKAKTEGAEET